MKKVKIKDLIANKDKYILFFEYGDYDNFVKAKLLELKINKIEYMKGIESWEITCECRYKYYDRDEEFIAFPRYYISYSQSFTDFMETEIDICEE